VVLWRGCACAGGKWGGAAWRGGVPVAGVGWGEWRGGKAGVWGAVGCPIWVLMPGKGVGCGVGAFCDNRPKGVAVCVPAVPVGGAVR